MLAERYSHSAEQLDMVFWHILTRLSYYRELHMKSQQLLEVRARRGAQGEGRKREGGRGVGQGCLTTDLVMPPPQCTRARVCLCAGMCASLQLCARCGAGLLHVLHAMRASKLANQPCACSHTQRLHV